MDEATRQSVLEKTKDLHKSHQRTSRTRRAIVGSIASVGILTGSLVAGPKAYALYGFQRMGGSLNDCKSAILEAYELGKDGQFHLDRTTIYSEGKWRMEYHGSTQVYADATLWSFDPELNQVTKSLRPEGPFAHNSSGISVKAMLADQTRFGWKDKTSLSNGTLDGRPAEVLTIEQATWPSRQVIYADPKSHMPFQITMENKKDGEWRKVGYMTFKLDPAIDSTQFEPNFPKEAKVVDLQKLKSNWAAKLEKPLAMFETNEGKVQIRDVAVNERGHVFIIYTNGETAQQRKEYGDSIRAGNIPQVVSKQLKWTVEDSIGTNYWASIKSFFQPYQDPIRKEREEWVVLKDGEVLQGQWFVPSVYSKWSPREISVKCWTAKSDKYSGTYTLKLRLPTTKLIPEWMPACAMGPRKPKDVYQEESDVHLVPDMIPVDPKTGKAIADKDGRVMQKYHPGR